MHGCYNRGMGNGRWRLAGQFLTVFVTDAVIYYAGGQMALLRRPVGAIYLALWTAWMVATVLGRKRGVPSPHEEKVWARTLGGVVAFVVLLWVGPWEYSHLNGPLPRDGVLAWTGLTVLLIGIVVQSLAMRALHGYFTVGLGAQPGHVLVNSGRYRLVRHPAYLSYILSLAGCGLALGSVAVTALIPLTLLYLVWRMPREERGLTEEFGDAYTQYRARTRWRLLPGVY